MSYTRSYNMHSFQKNPIDAKKLLSKPKLRSFVKNAEQIAFSLDAKMFYEGSSFKEVAECNEWSPKYFGSAIEFLCEMFLDHYGSHFNLNQVTSTDDWDSSEVDLGVDHKAMSVKQNGNIRPSSPVFIQTKGTLNSNKVFTANDGSRITNFMSYAQATAIKSGHAYTARYILFTTGKNIHYKLDAMTGKQIEVINFNKIKKMIDDDEVFWNKMRSALGVPLVDIKLCAPDADFVAFCDKNS